MEGPACGGYLHATNLLACHRGTTRAFELQPGVAREVGVMLDQADPVCGVPATIANMKLQEWAVRYELRPEP